MTKQPQDSNASTTIRQYAKQQTAARLGRVVFELRRARKPANEEAIHHLRVAIRRFAQATRVFSTLIPDGESKKIRKKLRGVMKLAGEVRNLDIARTLIRESKVAHGGPLLEQVAAERKEAVRRLAEALRELADRDFSTRWRQRLQLDT